jgi:hypothetical protein
MQAFEFKFVYYGMVPVLNITLPRQSAIGVFFDSATALILMRLVRQYCPVMVNH